MADFEYIAVDKKGKTRTGVISAADSKSARRKAIQSGLTVLKIKMSGTTTTNSNGSSNTGDKENKESSLKTKYSSKGEAVGLEFLKRLLELHGSGMPVADAVKLLNYRLSDPQQKACLEFCGKN